VDSQRLIFSGKILKNDQTLSACNIHENDFLVVMISKVYAYHHCYMRVLHACVIHGVFNAVFLCLICLVALCCLCLHLVLISLN